MMHAQLFAVELFFNIYLILQYMAPAFVTMFKTVLRRQRVYLVHQGGFSTRHIISRFSRCRISRCLWAANGKEAEFVEYFPSQTPFTQPNPLFFQAHLPHSTCPFPLAPLLLFLFLTPALPWMTSGPASVSSFAPERSARLPRPKLSELSSGHLISSTCPGLCAIRTGSQQMPALPPHPTA